MDALDRRRLLAGAGASVVAAPLLRRVADAAPIVRADTFSITPDGWLYVNAAQVNRRPEYNAGRDEQQPPYAIVHLAIDAGPA